MSRRRNSSLWRRLDRACDYQLTEILCTLLAILVWLVLVLLGVSK